jgi:hypothetical protein
MPTKLAKLLRLQVLASAGAAPRPTRVVSSHGNHPDTGAASAARRKLRPVLVCHWRSHPVDGRLECRWRLEPREGSSDETPGQSPRLSKARPRRITPRRRRSTCGRWTTDKRNAFRSGKTSCLHDDQSVFFNLVRVWGNTCRC